jgi:hypothetical protein
VILGVIAIKVLREVDDRGSEIRWLNGMTHVLPSWCWIPNLDGGDRVWLRYLHEGVLRQQIVNGITYFSVTTSRDGVIIIDIRRKRRG